MSAKAATHSQVRERGVKISGAMWSDDLYVVLLLLCGYEYRVRLGSTPNPAVYFLVTTHRDRA